MGATSSVIQSDSPEIDHHPVEVDEDIFQDDINPSSFRLHQKSPTGNSVLAKPQAKTTIKSSSSKLRQKQSFALTKFTKEQKTANISRYIDGAFSDSSKDHSVFKNLLRDTETKKLFKIFLKEECVVENLEFFDAVEKIKLASASSSNGIQINILESMTNDLIAAFLTPGLGQDISGNISKSLCRDIQEQILYKNRTEEEAMGLLENLEQAQNEIIFLLTMSMLPKFMQSTLYQDYINGNKIQTPYSFTMSRSYDPTPVPSNNDNSDSGSNYGSNFNSSVVPSASTSLITPQKPLRVLDSQDRDFIHGPQGSWISALFAASESLPICISLATARKDRPGFPLIHVNHVFESTTGYSRDQIIGSNCRFLQKRNMNSILQTAIIGAVESTSQKNSTTLGLNSNMNLNSSMTPSNQVSLSSNPSHPENKNDLSTSPSTSTEQENTPNHTNSDSNAIVPVSSSPKGMMNLEKDISKMTLSESSSIEQLSIALGSAKPVKVCITNFKKDGTPFTNLLAMKPIYDENGLYRYVVGVQFDVSCESNNSSMLHLADMLLNMIPNIIYCSPDEYMRI